jgi:hypothetical protein
MQLENNLSIQEAIDLAVKENRIVSFSCTDSNDEIRKAMHDLKGCDVIKGKPEDDMVHVFPESFSFLG